MESIRVGGVHTGGESGLELSCKWGYSEYSSMHVNICGLNPTQNIIWVGDVHSLFPRPSSQPLLMFGRQKRKKKCLGGRKEEEMIGRQNFWEEEIWEAEKNVCIIED